MRAVFVDANPALADAAEKLWQPTDIPLEINRKPEMKSSDLPSVIGDASIALIDHTALPTEIAKNCSHLHHVVFLGTGARSYMNPEELAASGITVHIIKGYGDTAVAEMAIALMWSAAKRLGNMDRGIRSGLWLQTQGLQLTGKTLGLIGFGGIAAEVARLAAGMRVLAWNRTAKSHPGVKFVPIEQLLAESHVVSLHLLLTDETRRFLTAERLSLMRTGAILVNTARGALIDEDAMVAALQSGKLSYAALDVFYEEPLPHGHPLDKLAEHHALSSFRLSH